MAELFNGWGTCITSDDKSLLFEWMYPQLNHWLSQGVVRYLPWLFPVPLLWRLPIPFGRGIMNAIWVCGGVVCLLFCLSMAIKTWEPTFWRYKCSHVWVSVPRIKLIMSFLSQYHPNQDIKYDLYEKGHYFTVHISYFETKIKKKISIQGPLYAAYIDIFQFVQKSVFDHNKCTTNWFPLRGNCDGH